MTLKQQLSIGMACTMGVGCDEAGVCYAEAHGEPDRCPSRELDRAGLIAENERLRDILRRLRDFDGWDGTFDSRKALDAKNDARATLANNGGFKQQLSTSLVQAAREEERRVIVEWLRRSAPEQREYIDGEVGFYVAANALEAGEHIRETDHG